jgi:hypothetical protein
MTMFELTDMQNLALEVLQESFLEAAKSLSKSPLVSAGCVVDYAARVYGQAITKRQASRALGWLHDNGLARREPRGSWGWALGWQPSYYKITKAGFPPTLHPLFEEISRI